ncbi:MAG: ArsA family ATPase [Bdellovibrionales bacterium]
MILCAGTGGVGKTSLSAAMGLKIAQKGKKVLVITIDPAQRLKSALGIEQGCEQVFKVKEFENGGEFYACQIDAKKTFDEFVDKVSPSLDAASELKKNLLYRRLSEGLQGSQEFTSLEKFLMEYQSKQYDLIVVDTPPSQHALDFLEAPKKLYKLFDESILRWFVSEADGESSFLKKVLQSGTRKAFGVLDRLTGKEFVDAIYNFFGSMRFVGPALVEDMRKVDKLLHSKEVGFVLVTSFDSRKISQARDFFRSLKKKKYNFIGVVVNRAFVSMDPPSQEFMGIYEQFNEYYKKENELLNDLIGEFSSESLEIKFVQEDLKVQSSEDGILELSKML